MSELSLGAYCFELPSGQVVFDLAGTHQLYPASTLKLAVLIAAWRACDRGDLSREDSITVRDSWVGVDGSRFALADADRDPVLQARVGFELTVAELLDRMITVSSNEASNLLIDRLGFETVNATLLRVGAADSRLSHYFGDRGAWRTSSANVSTPADLARMAAGIAAGTAASEHACAEMLALLRQQTDRSLIAASLPEHVVCGNKTGQADGVLHDVAIVELPEGRAYAVAVCTWGCDDIARATAAIRRQAAAIQRLVCDEPSERRIDGTNV